MKLIIAAAVLAAACGPKDYTVYTFGTATVTGSTNVTRASALDRITAERCNRELACANIGPRGTWSDMDSCRVSVRDDTATYLKADVCGGVDFYDLAVCANAIRNAQCTPKNTTPRFSECDAAKICRSTW